MKIHGGIPDLRVVRIGRHPAPRRERHVALSPRAAVIEQLTENQQIVYACIALAESDGITPRELEHMNEGTMKHGAIPAACELLAQLGYVRFDGKLWRVTEDDKCGSGCR